MQIYLARNNQQAGPYTVEQINQMLQNQQVLLTDLAWHQGMPEWKALGELTQGKLEFQPSGYVAQVAATNNETQNSAYQNPSIQKVNVTKKTDTVELASLGSRFLAKLIDLALWLPASYIATAFFTQEQTQKFNQLNEQLYQIMFDENANTELAQQIQIQIMQLIPSQAIIAMVIYILIMLGIQAYLIAKNGQSMGKKLLKIQIVDAENNTKVSLLRGFTLRSVIFIVLNLLTTPLISIIDFLFALGQKRQTLHDKMAKTKVIKR